MLDWLFVSQAQQRLLPGGRMQGPTPWVIAIMTFVMMIVSAAALALSNAAGSVSGQAEGRFVAQLPDEGRALQPVLTALQAMPQVSEVEAVPEVEMRETLARWLGPAAFSADLPVPAIVHFDLSARDARAAVERRLAAIAPGTVISAHGEKVGPLLGTMRALQWLALALVLMMIAATSATVVLAARGALDTHRPTIDIMHGIGATDLQVAHLFQRKIALDASIGAAAGATVAAVSLFLLIGGNAALSGDLGGAAPLRWIDVLLLAVLPFGLAIIATWVARKAVLTALRKDI